MDGKLKIAELHPLKISLRAGIILCLFLFSKELMVAPHFMQQLEVHIQKRPYFHVFNLCFVVLAYRIHLNYVHMFYNIYMHNR